MRFVRFSSQALPQGVVNTKIDRVPVRIYSAAKTIVDYLKYRRKIGGNLAVKMLRESIARRKCSEQRFRHFVEICRVGKLVQAAYSGCESMSFRNVVSEPIPDERMHIALGLQWRKRANRKIKQIDALV